MIVTYLLIGALPHALLLTLIVSVGYIVFWQSKASLVLHQLEGYMEQSWAATEALGRDVPQWIALSNGSGNDENRLRRDMQERIDTLSAMFPGAQLSLLISGKQNSVISVKGNVNPEGGESSFPDVTDFESFPLWLNKKAQFDGITVEKDSENNPVVRVRHILHLTNPQDVVIQLTYPLGNQLCWHLSHTTDLIVKPGGILKPLIKTANGTEIAQFESAQFKHRTDNDYRGYPIYKRAIDWKSGRKFEGDVLRIDMSFLLPAEIMGKVREFRTGSAIGNLLVPVVYGLTVVFFLMALTAVIFAFILMRSITRAFNHLYSGTKKIEEGDWDHEIPIDGRDQIGELIGSFNRMSKALRRLLRVSAEKQRLDEEMRIASQVQSMLFPRSIPTTQKLDISPGICIPARSVSGDYFDYFSLAAGKIGIAVADVCGKGVSAALMMANLQAVLRSCVKLCPESVRKIIQGVNEQLVHSMDDSRFITLFYAQFDESTNTLSWTNAGHNPPLLYRASDKSIHRLEGGGTVLGVFADYQYEDFSAILYPGDVVVAFSDGIIEANNLSEEEYGEARVIKTLIENVDLSASQLEQKILQSVRSWTSLNDQEDDLTLVVFKVIS